MAIDDIQTLYEQCRYVFALRELAQDWEDWRMIPIPIPESTEPEPIERDFFAPEKEQTTNMLAHDDSIMRRRQPNIPAFTERVAGPHFSYPGSTRRVRELSPCYASPDALSFYLPFHHYYALEKPALWGIYLVAEGTRVLADIVYRGAKGALSHEDASTISRIFLYGVQAFHHAVESFATRLEITHRTPVYTKGIAQLFHETRGQAGCVEEALAAAYGYQKVKKSVGEVWKQDKPKQKCALRALEMYLQNHCYPAYDQGMKFVNDKDFREARATFAEENHSKTFDHQPLEPSLWFIFSQAFRGIGRVDSRVKYLVHRYSSLDYRQQLLTKELQFV